MPPSKFVPQLAALTLTAVLSFNAQSIVAEPTFDFTFDFTGECDDCAFNGLPTDPGFDPLNDGLTETVSATLSLVGLSVNADGLIEFRGAGSATFSYHGSSLINPFTMSDPFLFTHALTTTGEVRSGSTFTFGSSQNTADPNNPLSFEFPNFCTALGRQVLDQQVRNSDCDDIGLVQFSLDSDGSWGIEGSIAFDVGGAGQFVPAGPANNVPEPLTVALVGLGLAGMSLTRRRAN